MATSRTSLMICYCYFFPLYIFSVMSILFVLVILFVVFVILKFFENHRSKLFITFALFYMLLSYLVCCNIVGKYFIYIHTYLHTYVCTCVVPFFLVLVLNESIINVFTSTLENIFSSSCSLSV